jgi:flagellar operon protein
MNKVDQGVGIVQSKVHRIAAQSTRSPRKDGDFSAVLAKETQRLESLKISSHAQKRLASSRIELSPSDIERIDQAVRLASSKGANQSLVMLDNLALVVSVKNRVVITAIDEARTREGIFTNIDSVVIA